MEMRLNFCGLLPCRPNFFGPGSWPLPGGEPISSLSGWKCAAMPPHLESFGVGQIHYPTIQTVAGPPAKAAFHRSRPRRGQPCCCSKCPSSSPTAPCILARRTGPFLSILLLRQPQIHTDSSIKMGREEQIEEREVLDSIFPDEITGSLSPPPPILWPSHQPCGSRPD